MIEREYEFWRNGKLLVAFYNPVDPEDFVVTDEDDNVLDLPDDEWLEVLETIREEILQMEDIEYMRAKYHNDMEYDRKSEGDK